ncbi:MAG: 6-phosphogluconolactonase [Limnohabitans sp.]
MGHSWVPTSRGALTVHTLSPAELNVRLAQDIAQRLSAAIQARGFAVLGVSGGKSPVALFEALRVIDIAWSHVRVTLVDERCVPYTHPDSNACLVQTHLLQDLAAQAQLVRMVDAAAEPLAPPSRYADKADAALRAAGTADVLVLGMGTDGHTASLFPDAPNLTEALALRNPHACVAIELLHPPANAPYPRITQTLAHILTARHIVLPVSGTDKLQTLAQAWQHATPALPFSMVLHQTQTPVALWMAS